MPSFDFSNPEVQAALISGAFNVVSALIAAIAAAIIGNTIANRRKLKETIKTAINDIAFLLEVEALHCENNARELGRSRKYIVRKEIRDSGLTFSGKLTPGRVRSGKPLG